MCDIDRELRVSIDHSYRSAQSQNTRHVKKKEGEEGEDKEKKDGHKEITFAKNYQVENEPLD